MIDRYTLNLLVNDLRNLAQKAKEFLDTKLEGTSEKIQILCDTQNMAVYVAGGQVCVLEMEKNHPG